MQKVCYCMANAIIDANKTNSSMHYFNFVDNLERCHTLRRCWRSNCRCRRLRSTFRQTLLSDEVRMRYGRIFFVKVYPCVDNFRTSKLVKSLRCIFLCHFFALWTRSFTVTKLGILLEDFCKWWRFWFLHRSAKVAESLLVGFVEGCIPNCKGTILERQIQKRYSRVLVKAKVWM